MAPERRSDSRQTGRRSALTRRPRRWSAPNRWSSWTRSLATRHLRLATGRELLDLVVARPRSLVRILRERWLVTSRRVQPRIELAIHAILKLTVNQQQHSSVIHTSAQSSVMQTATFLNTTNVLNATNFSTRQFSHGSVPSSAQTVSKADASGKAFETIPSPNPEDVIFNAATPLTFVFRRVQETQKLTHSRVLEALMDQREHSITRRVTQRSRRNETMVTTASTLTRRQTVSTETEAIPSHSMKLAPLMKLTPAAVNVFERSATTVPATSTVESTSWQKESTPPELNLDEITDQVVRRLDHRVIALRERMGRV